MIASTTAQVALAAGTPAQAVDGAREAFTIDPASLEYRLLYARVLRLQGAASDAALLLVGLPDETLAMAVVAEELALAFDAEGRFEQSAQAWHRTRVHGANARLLSEEGLSLVRASNLAAAARVLDELRALGGATAEVSRLDAAIHNAAQP
ncbi:MAG: hypothetical protein EXS10_04195 [Phycisphaerales bacterium]|nr:hypothetical protein [Phycisphaerales bacterium]